MRHYAIKNGKDYFYKIEGQNFGLTNQLNADEPVLAAIILHGLVEASIWLLHAGRIKEHHGWAPYLVEVEQRAVPAKWVNVTPDEADGYQYAYEPHDAGRPFAQSFEAGTRGPRPTLRKRVYQLKKEWVEVPTNQ